MKEDGSYFVAIAYDHGEDFEDIEIFPVWFNTTSYDEALKLVTCIVDGNPKKRLMYTGFADRLRDEKSFK